MRSPSFFHGAAVFVASALSLLAYVGCSSDATQDPSYLRVELVPAITAAKIPRAVRVVIANESTNALIESLCIDIEGAQGTTTASFVLRRDVGKLATDRISIELTPFDALDGQDGVGPGKEFACPVTLPPAIGPTRKVSLDFCEAQTRTLVFHVNALCCDNGGCICDAGFVCGVGVADTGVACGPSTCCSKSIASACELDI